MNDKDESLIPFRLVFKQNDAGKLVTIAIAEKPATISELPAYESPDEIKKQVESGSAICNMSINTKRRLCEIMINAPMFRKTYFALTNNYEPPCYARTVSFCYNDQWLTTKEDIDVWTVECEAKKRCRIGFDLPTVFYIFRGSGSPSFFIAENQKDTIKVIGSFNS